MQKIKDYLMRNQIAYTFQDAEDEGDQTIKFEINWHKMLVLGWVNMFITADDTVDNGNSIIITEVHMATIKQFIEEIKLEGIELSLDEYLTTEVNPEKAKKVVALAKEIIKVWEEERDNEDEIIDEEYRIEEEIDKTAKVLGEQNIKFTVTEELIEFNYKNYAFYINADKGTIGCQTTNYDRGAYVIEKEHAKIMWELINMFIPYDVNLNPEAQVIADFKSQKQNLLPVPKYNIGDLVFAFVNNTVLNDKVEGITSISDRNWTNIAYKVWGRTFSEEKLFSTKEELISNL